MSRVVKEVVILVGMFSRPFCLLFLLLFKLLFSSATPGGASSLFFAVSFGSYKLGEWIGRRITRSSREKCEQANAELQTLRGEEREEFLRKLRIDLEEARKNSWF
ncbi:hypothetical protein L1049_015715 [Liquidambar formosana]|uniref:Uncharacterized protein n=1 Tax=Liquidambar formosana TaxID=63359 RepID=A0AAP0X225_LIQFO